MPQLETQGISLNYDLFGNPSSPPLLMIAGLGGVGSQWGSQVERFARDYYVILPDHRGTGRSSRAEDGYTITQHAADMAALLRFLGLGRVHVLGTSTGGAIAQLLALDAPELVRSIVMADSFAYADPYCQREFAFRRGLLANADPQTVYWAYAMFLFSPTFMRDHGDRVDAWVERAASAPLEREIGCKRIDMILAHDSRARLGEIRHPVLVIHGDHDACTPPYMSEQIVAALPNVESAELEGGHMIHFEQEAAYHDTVHAFLQRY